MSDLRELQQSFFGYVLGVPGDMTQRIESTADTSAEQRMGIYASGYRLRLKEALETDFDRLYSYMGDALFEQLMDRYIDTHVSHNPSLRYYSQHLCALLETQKPFSNVPELLEIAHIEEAFNHSFDAKNARATQMAELAQLPEDAWPTLTLQFDASIRILLCEYNSFPIWKALSEDQTPPPLEKDPTPWLVWRKDMVSRYRAMEDAEAKALDKAMGGANFSEICEVLLEHFDEHDTPVRAIGYLQTWINEKMICGLGR